MFPKCPIFRIGSEGDWCFFTVLRHNSRNVKSGARRKLRSGDSDPDLKRKCGIRLNIGLTDRSGLCSAACPGWARSTRRSGRH
eukprot:5328130-Pyramimonas_sp.AAC.1